MNEAIVYNGRLNIHYKNKNFKKNRKKVVSMHRNRREPTDIYQKAVQEYEDYKRIHKNNLHVSSQETSEADLN